MQFLAVKLDIIRSRRISNRALVQETLLRAVDAANERFLGSLQSTFVVTHGDEVQGLLGVDEPEKLVDVIEHFVDSLEPIELRFGVGFGTLNTSLRPVAIGMDGEAWYRAQAAIEVAAREHKFAQFSGFGETADEAISAVTNMLLFLRWRWSREQRAVVSLLQTNATQAQIAAHQGVSEAAISKRLAAAGWRFYRDGRKALGSLLEGAVLQGQATPEP